MPKVRAQFCKSSVVGGVCCLFKGAPLDSVEKGVHVGSMLLQYLWKLGSKKEGYEQLE